MCSGICPPSKRSGTWYRALVPLVPRPAVLPLDASPRPTRVLAVLAPGAGRRWCTLSVPPLPGCAAASAAFAAAAETVFFGAAALGSALAAFAFGAASVFASDLSAFAGLSAAAAFALV